MVVLRSMLGILALASSVGCSSRTTFQAPVYDTCGIVDECVETASRCEELAVDFGGYTYVNAICTLECATPGPLSPDCPRAWVGRAGSCYPASVADGADATPVCFEPCDFDSDCLASFRCLGARDLCGAAVQCPIDEGDAICVPGPP